MTFLVIGGSGLVGYEFYRQFEGSGNWHFTYKEHKMDGKGFLKLDASDKAEVEQVVSELSPETIIVTAAMPNVNLCEKEPEKSYKYNVSLMSNVLSACKKRPAKIVFFSTDYVFDGKAGPYDEEAEPNPINVYGKHKLETEKLIIKSGLDHLIVRTTGIYGLEKNRKNFLYRVNDTLGSGKELPLPIDMFSNATYVTDLARVTNELLKRKKKGVFNVVGREYLSRYQLGVLFADALGLNTKLVAQPRQNDAKDVAPRPPLGGLTCGKITELGLQVRTINEGIMDILDRGGLDKV